METYYITLEKGSVIYRGFSDRNKKDGKWYAYTIKDASMYGNTIKSYRVKEDIKLVNIMNPLFHMDYIEKLNFKFPGNDYNGIDETKLRAMIPLGLPDIETQQIFLHACGISGEKLQIKDNFVSRLFYNKNRFTMYGFDSIMASCIEEFFKGKCDGFTNPFRYTDKYTGGSLAREIYIFDLGSLEYIETIQVGGGQPIDYMAHFQIGREEFMRGVERAGKLIEQMALSMPMIKRDDGTDYSNTPIIRKPRRNKTRKNRPSDDVI